MQDLLWLTPWLVPFAYVALRLRFPPPLPPAAATEPGGTEPPLVSVIVPARNEALNIVACLESLTANRYAAFEVLVVDDRSTDGTAELAGSVSAGSARSIRVIQGAPLPTGWYGKPWACHQGAGAAAGTVLLFTDADTVHAADLLSRAVAGLDRQGGGALSLIGRQLMKTFWERVVQPQMFALLMMRYPDLATPRPRARWRSAIANGQFLMVERDVYRAVNGHACVAGEVVEDLRIAQELVRAGHRLRIWSAEDGLATRMYRSLGGIIEGWSKNFWTATRQSTPSRLGGLMLPLALLSHAALWVAPPVVLILSLVLGAHATFPVSVRAGATAATALGVLFWTAATVRAGVPARYGLLFPLGAATAGFILARSWWLGPRITWKGRAYEGGSL